MPFTRDFFLNVTAAYHDFSSPRARKLTVVGDSIVGGQLNNLRSMLRNDLGGVEVCSVRKDDLKVEEGSLSPWVREVCTADVALINTGAHYHSVEKFEERLRMALKTLKQACPETLDAGRVFFRTTAEGNPLCKSPAHKAFRDMADWDANVMTVINGSKPPPEDALYQPGWHWDKFKYFNAVASRLAPLYNVTLLDVVPMTRLRPFSQTPSKNSKLDCLHGNPATSEWNTVFFNALAATACQNDHPTTRTRSDQRIAKAAMVALTEQ